MSRRESRNPISGSAFSFRWLIVSILFLLFSSAVIFLFQWSYYSCVRASVLHAEGIWRLLMWPSYAFSVGLCPLDGETWAFLLSQWKVMLAIDALILLLFLLMIRRHGNFWRVEYGASHWMTWWERRVFRQTKKDPGIPIADRIWITVRAHLANMNFLVLGAPGSGKTFTVIIPMLEALTRGMRKKEEDAKEDGEEKQNKKKKKPEPRQSSFLCTDTKGALFRDTCRMMQGRGIKTFLLNLANPWYSDRYNPLYNIHEERKYTEISRLAMAFAKNARDEEGSVGDSIWEDTFRSLLVAVWSYQYDYQRNPTNDKEETRAMWRTAELIRSLKLGQDNRVSKEGELYQIVEAIRVTHPIHPAVENFDFIAAGAGETIASVVFTAGSKINVFTYPEVQSLTDGNDIPLDWVCENPGGIYLNFEIGSPYRVVAALFIEQLFSAAYYLAETKHNGRLPLDLQMFLDELPNICRVYSLPERASTSRSYGINLIISVQSMQQLERMFDKAEETLKNNCVTHIYLGTGEQKALKEISEALGKTTTEELSRSRNVGGKNGGGGSDSDKAIGRELVFPAEIHSMPDQYAIIKIQHYQPIFAKKFQTAKQPWYPELGGKGSPENSCSIEDAYRIPSLARQWQYYEQRLQRIERMKEART